jgi:hypothetical protein
MHSKPNPRQPATQRICTHCGKEFTVTHARIRQGSGKYCGRPCASAHRTPPTVEHFWSKVLKSEGCWLWQAGTFARGYGCFTIRRRNYQSHRIAWELTYGPIPGGMFICHKCDNPRCVRPDHLFLGTPKDNMDDKTRKGRARYTGPHRSPLGENGPKAKLTDDQVRDIRSRYRPRMVTMQQLAAEFGVAKATIADVIYRRHWPHI